MALPAGTLVCPCSPATWMLGACAAGGKTTLRGALALPCTLRPMQWVPKCYTWQHLDTSACGRRDPLCVLPQEGACSDPGAETHVPSTPDVKRMSPACAAKPNSVHETCPEIGWHVPTPEEKKKLGFVQVPAQCSLSHCVASPSSLPGCWVILTALPWLGSLQTSRDAGERPLHPQQEGTCASHVSGSWDQSLHSSFCPGCSFSPCWQQGLYFFLIIERGHPIPLLQVPADLGKKREVK